MNDKTPSDEKAQMDARAVWHKAGSPDLCPRCGGWDGPALPFCKDGGRWTHGNTCVVYRCAQDLCASCETSSPTG